MSSVILVAQIKGGCAKSTTAMQLIAPWVMSREGRAKLIEIDHQNQDSEDYRNTEIKTKQIELPEKDSHTFAATQLMQEIIASDESIVIDLGGNATASELISEIGKVGVSSFIDLVVVPVTSSGRDVLNASATIQHIRDSFTGFEAPILLVYSRATTSDLSRLKFEASDIFTLVDEVAVHGPLVIPQRGCLASSRYMFLTVWEIINQSQDMVSEIQREQLDAKKNKDVEKGNQLVNMRAIVEDSLSLAPFFQKAFSQLDSILALEGVSVHSSESSEAVPGQKEEPLEVEDE